MILKSRKFWLAVLDIVISTVTYFVTKYVSPDIGNDIMWLIAAWQPVVIMLIAGIAIEDAAEKRNPAYFVDMSDTVAGTDE